MTAEPSPWPDDQSLIAALRQGDESAFATLIEHYHPSLIRIATLFVRDREIAEEVAQETWIGVLRGIERFEGRSSIRTWLFSILANQAKRRGERERRIVPFAALTGPEANDVEPAVDPARFLPPGDDYSGHWANALPPWETSPEAAVLAAEGRREIEEAIAALPPHQRAVITLRDIEGWDAADVCNVLQLSPTNQRVLLHRARSRVRAKLEESLGGKRTGS